MSVERLAREIVDGSDGRVPWPEAYRMAWWVTMAAWDGVRQP
jgi:hypothetical protein